MPQPVSEFDDIQALVHTGFGRLEEACFLLLRVADAAKAKAWLAAVAAAPGAEALPYQLAHAADIMEHRERRELRDRALQVAISAAGLRRLGASEDLVGAFSREFTIGSSSADAEAEGRARRLGDVGPSAPSEWDWGAPGAAPDVLVMLYAAHGGLDAFRELVGANLALGFTVLRVLSCAPQNKNKAERREPFGFVDGVSQPEIDWDGRRETGVMAASEYGNLIAPGEFLLGYPNEYGLFTDRPLLAPEQDPEGVLAPAEDDPGRRDLGRNGTYLVLRQLEQDVGGFWRFADAQSPAGGGVALAEAMVGRRLRSGEPLVPVERRDIPGVGPKADDFGLNNFTYDADPEGLSCPFGAHVRRANPRGGDIPGGRQNWLSWALRMLGLKHGGPREDLVSSSRLHRLIRRGRAYGEYVDREAAKTAAPAGERGIHFISLNANISRQFEFVQTAWIMNGNFNGMSGETDPLLGGRSGLPEGKPTDAFRLPQPSGPAREIAGLPQFIKVRGSAYFFLPGLRALRFIARLEETSAGPSS